MKRRLLLFALMAALLCACATVPYTGRSQLSMLNQQDELNLAQSATKDVMAKSKIAARDFRISIIDDMGKRLVAAVHPDAGVFDWRFFIINDDTVNAFTTGDGSVFFYKGMFEWAENSAQVAAVMGHEMGHVIARHMGERYSQRTLSSLFGALGAIAVGVGTGSAEVAQGFMDIYGSTAEVVALLPFSRTQEYEADYIGLLIMAEAGYDPREAVNLWRTSLEKNSQQLTDLFSTHPLDQSRVTELEKHLPQAMGLYEAAQKGGKTPDGKINMKKKSK